MCVCLAKVPPHRMFRPGRPSPPSFVCYCASNTHTRAPCFNSHYVWFPALRFRSSAHMGSSSIFSVPVRSGQRQRRYGTAVRTRLRKRFTAAIYILRYRNGNVMLDTRQYPGRRSVVNFGAAVEANCQVRFLTYGSQCAA